MFTLNGLFHTIFHSVSPSPSLSCTTCRRLCRFHSDDAILWDPQRINYTSGRDGVATSSKISVSSYITDNNSSRDYLLINWICVFVCGQLASEDAGNTDVHQRQILVLSYTAFLFLVFVNSTDDLTSPFLRQ